MADYKETRWLGMRKQTWTRAGNYQRHARARAPARAHTHTHTQVRACPAYVIMTICCLLVLTIYHTHTVLISVPSGYFSCCTAISMPFGVYFVTHTHTHCGRCMLWWRYLAFPLGLSCKHKHTGMHMSCLCRYDKTLPTGPISLTHTLGCISYMGQAWAVCQLSVWQC